MEGLSGYASPSFVRSTAEELCSCLRCQAVCRAVVRGTRTKPENWTLWDLSGTERELAVEFGAMDRGQRFGRRHGQVHECEGRN